MSKQPLICESVAVIQIYLHPTGEEPDQHIVPVAPRVLEILALFVLF
jgi:hypothetical protein